VSAAWEGGSTRAWRRLRAAVLEENRVKNGGRCRAQCVDICTTIATSAHHTLGRNVTGDDPRHIVAICADCNLHIGDPMQHPKECKACAHIAWHPGNSDPKPTPVTKW
jgi:hypothetical protein